MILATGRRSVPLSARKQTCFGGIRKDGEDFCASGEAAEGEWMMMVGTREVEPGAGATCEKNVKENMRLEKANILCYWISVAVDQPYPFYHSELAARHSLLQKIYPHQCAYALYLCLFIQKNCMHEHLFCTSTCLLKCLLLSNTFMFAAL